MAKDDASTLVGALPAAQREVVAALRETVRRVVPHAVESMLWGSLSYHRPETGGRVKGAVCLVTAKRGEVRLEFIHGVRLRDPSRLLRGTGISKRFVAVRSAAEARAPGIEALLLEAARVDWPRRGRRSGARRP